MSFYTIDGRFVNKKNVVEGFFDNRVIEHATIGIDNQDASNEEPPTDEEPPTNQGQMDELVDDMNDEDSNDTPNEEETPLENEDQAPEAPEAPEDEVTEQTDAVVPENVNEPVVNEVPMTNEMKEDKSLHMHFCINGKCLTGNELRKLNELYDKKCTN
tara:strand:- start:100 stop:573 length:474 start_codon:yes stop_codon:yes gene_type:complete